MPQPNNPRYGTSQQQIAQMAGMIEASRRERGGSRPDPSATDMSEMLRGELEQQRSSKVGTAVQKATLMPGMALSAVSRMDNLDSVIAKAVAKISKVRGAAGAGGAGAGVDTAGLTDAITKMGGLGYLGTSGVLNVPRQKRLAYEQQHRKQLGATGTASSALSTLSLANRAVAAPRVASMVYGGGMPSSVQGAMGMYDVGRPLAGKAAKMAGMNLPASMMDPSSMSGLATGMAPMIAAQMGLGMMKAKKMAKITAQRSSGGAEESKFSFSSSLDAQINMLAARGQLQPGDQLQIQIMKWIEAHTSVLPEMWADQKYLREEKEKGVIGAGQAYGKATTGMTDDGVISKAVGSAEGFMSRTVAKYDIFGQLFNFISTGKLPKQFQEELQAAYASGSDRKDWKKTAKERGIGIAQSRLLEMTSQQIIDMAPSYEVKMLNVLGASFDIQRLQASELLTIRRSGFGIPDTVVKSDDYEQSAIGKLWDVLKSPAEMLTNIPGVNALWNMLKLPFSMGSKVRTGAKGAWGAAKGFMLGGEETQELLESEETLRKKAGVYKSPQEMANEFMGRGLPDIMEEMRGVSWRQLQELSNIYGVLHVLTQQTTGIAHKRDDRTYNKQTKKGVWSYTAGKYLDESGLAEQQKQDRERMLLTLEGAFKGTGMDRLGFIINKLTGKGGATVEERLSGAAGMVRGVEAMPYDMAAGGQRRGGIAGALQMALASPLIEIGEEMTLTPEETMETAMYRQRGVRGRGRARVVPGWFGAEQARKQMGFEQDIVPRMQRQAMGGIGGLAAGAGAGILGGAASLATGGALLPLLLAGGLGGAAGAIPQNILEFMQTQKTFEGLSGEDIVRMTAGFAEMPDVFEPGDKQYIKKYLKKSLSSEAYNTIGVDKSDFFENINNLGFIQMALQTKGGSSAGLAIGVGGGDVFKGGRIGVGADVSAIPGGLYGLMTGIHSGQIDPLPIQISGVSEEMILKFPGLFQVSDDWKAINDEAKRRDEEMRQREVEKERVRAEAQRMRGMSASDKQRMMDKKSMSDAEYRQSMIDEQWAEEQSPRVKRKSAAGRQREIERTMKKYQDEMSDEEIAKPHRGILGKIIDFPQKLGAIVEEKFTQEKRAAAKGGVVGQTGLAYVHKGEIISGPKMLLKMLTGSSEDAMGAAGAYGRGLKSELMELKEKAAQTKAYKWMDSMLSKLGEIDENTEDVDAKGVGKKSKKKKDKAGFDLSSIMTYLPLIIPAILAILGGAAGGGVGGVPGAIVGAGVGVGGGLFASKKAWGATKTLAGKAKPYAGRAARWAGRGLRTAAGGLGRGLAAGARTVGAAGLTALAGVGGTVAGAYRAQEKYGDPLGEKLSALQKIGLGAGTGLKWATLGAIDVDKMTGTSKVIEQVKKSKEQTKSIKSKTTTRLEGNTSPDGKKLYIYDKEGNITNFMMLRYKKLMPSISNRYGWVTLEESDAEQAIKEEIKVATGKTIKKFSRIDNNLHKDAIRKYEQARDRGDEEYTAHYAKQVAAWSNIPPDTQVKMLQQQEGRLKAKAGDAPKSPASKYTKSDADKLKEAEKKVKNVETAAKASVQNEAKRLQEKKRQYDEAVKEKKKTAGLMGSASGRMLAAGGSTAAAGKVMAPGTGGMPGMGGTTGVYTTGDGIYRGDDERVYDTSNVAGVDQVEQGGGWWGKVKSALGFSDKKFKYKALKFGKGMGKGGFMWPGTQTVTSPYGPRRTKLAQASKMHKGVDMRADDVVAAFKGKVTGSGPNWGSVVISHGDLDPRKGFTTHYLHLANKQVKVGDEVNPGDVIGQAGNVGPIPGMKKHLHFSIKHNRKWYDPELVFKSLDPSFNPEYANDIVPGRQLGAKLGGEEIDLSKLGIEGEEAAGPFGVQRYNPGAIRSDLADAVGKHQMETKQRQKEDTNVESQGPLAIPLPVASGSERVMDDKDLAVTDPTLDTFIRNLFVDCAYEFNNRYKNYAYNSNVGHAFS